MCVCVYAHSSNQYLFLYLIEMNIQRYLKFVLPLIINMQVNSNTFDMYIFPHKNNQMIK